MMGGLGNGHEMSPLRSVRDRRSVSRQSLVSNPGKSLALKHEKLSVHSFERMVGCDENVSKHSRRGSMPLHLGPFSWLARSTIFVSHCARSRHKQIRWEDTNRHSIPILTHRGRGLWPSDEYLVRVISTGPQYGRCSCPRAPNAGESTDAARVTSTMSASRVHQTPPA